MGLPDLQTLPGRRRRVDGTARLGRSERFFLVAVLCGILGWGFSGVDWSLKQVLLDSEPILWPPQVPLEKSSSAAVVVESQGDSALGRQLFEANGCYACHSIDGTEKIGPSLKGIWATAQRLSDGSTAVVDSAYVIESVLEPQARVVVGYDGQMPSYRGLVSESEAQAIAAYVESLQ